VPQVRSSSRNGFVLGNYPRSGNRRSIQLRFKLTEKKADAQNRTVAGANDIAVTHLIAELKECHLDRREMQEALSHPQRTVLVGGSDHKELVKAVEVGKAKENTARLKLRMYRRAKLRKRDFKDLIGLRADVHDLAGEIHAIFLDNDLYRQHLTHTPEATTLYQQHARRLLTIREKLARLKLAMDFDTANELPTR
jgi:hypothetical protein